MSRAPKPDPKADLTVLTRLELYFSLRLVTRTMRRFAALLDHDYDMLVIFLIVLESCLQAIMAFGGTKADLETIEKGYLESVSLGLSMLTIAETTGIPRETVRRKINDLVRHDLIAISEKHRTAYVPISALAKPDVLEMLSTHVVDAEQFVRAAQFYKSGA
jgi:hypothetical protein